MALRRPRGRTVASSTRSGLRTAHHGSTSISMSSALLVTIALGVLLGGTVGLVRIFSGHIKAAEDATLPDGDPAAGQLMDNGATGSDRRGREWVRLWKSGKALFPEEIVMDAADEADPIAAAGLNQGWEEVEDRQALGLAQDPQNSLDAAIHHDSPTRRAELSFEKDSAHSAGSEGATKAARNDVHLDATQANGFGTAGANGRPERQLQREDIVVAIATHRATEPQLKAGRAARLGMRTYVATNYTESSNATYPSIASETWGFYPGKTHDKPVRSFYPGDTRAALVPFLAYRALGESFQWLLYIDDDTVPFVDAAITAVQDLDPEMPYFVTDNFWWSANFGGAFHPNPEAPRCLPCGYARNVSALPIKLAVGCPCTPQAICNLNGGYSGTFGKRSKCGVPRTPARAYSMHGGAGALISVGLLRKVEWEAMERCVNHQWNSGGDAFITSCLWEQGFAMTTPDPLWHPEGLTKFDPSPPPLNPDDYILHKASHVLGNLLQAAAGACQGICQLELRQTVTLHLRARRTGGSDQGAALFIRAFSRFYARLSRQLTSMVKERQSTTKLATDGNSVSQKEEAAEKEVLRLAENAVAATGQISSSNLGSKAEGLGAYLRGRKTDAEQAVEINGVSSLMESSSNRGLKNSALEAKTAKFHDHGAGSHQGGLQGQAQERRRWPGLGEVSGGNRQGNAAIEANSKGEHGPNKDVLDDTTNGQMAELAARIDAELDAGVEAVRQLLAQLQVSNKGRKVVSRLSMDAAHGHIDISDRVRAGAVDAVATIILRIILASAELLDDDAEASTSEAAKAINLPGEGTDDLAKEMNKVLLS